MLTNYLKIIWKVLRRRKFFTFISVFGVAFTLMVLTIGSAVLDTAVAPGAPEVHLDRTLFLNYMIMQGASESSPSCSWWSSPGYRLLDRYMRDLPGVENFSISSEELEAVAFVRGARLQSRMRYTDGAFWEILQFVFLEGGPFTEEDNRNGNRVAVISQATRRQYFGAKPAMGNLVEYGQQCYRVIGVVEDVPLHRSSATADLWVPIGTFPNPEVMENLMGGFQGMMLAENRSDFPRIKGEFQARLDQVEFPDPERFDRLVGRLKTRSDDYLSSVSDVDEEGELVIRHQLPVILAMVAVFLMLPVINLVSINMSRIFERASEIGVRKAFGASSLHLVGQFVLENIVLCLAGGALALVGVFACLALINASGLVPQASFTINYRVFIYALVLSGFFGLLSGAYPAWRMSRLHPVDALRGGIR